MTDSPATEEGRRCTLCGEPIDWREEWQAFAGRAFVGHREHAEAEAAKWVLVQVSDLREAMALLMALRVNQPITWENQPITWENVEAYKRLHAVLVPSDSGDIHLGKED